MKNYIQISGRQVTLDPKNDQEYSEAINTCNHILAVMVVMGTSNTTDDKTRVESIMSMSGKIGGEIAKKALIMIANQKTAENPPKEEKKAGGDDA